MKSSETDIVGTLGDLEALMALMKQFGAAIVELPGGLKVVLAPEQTLPAPLQHGGAEQDLPEPYSLDSDPALYPDGDVPRFVRS